MRTAWWLGLACVAGWMSTAARAGETAQVAPPPALAIDASVSEATGLAVGAGVDDAVFLRRVFVDLTGRVPSADEARAFLDDSGADKRARLVDRLLATDEFARHWGRVMAGWLLGERPLLREGYDGRALVAHLAQTIRDRRPFPRVAADLVTASGAGEGSGPVNFLLRYDADPVKLAGGVGKGLMGVTLQCAECHDHPFAAWQQDDFWGLAATFGRLRRMEADDGADGTLFAVHEARRAELMRPNPDRKPPAEGDEAPKAEAEGEGEEEGPPAEVAARPRLPDGSTLPAQGDRRRALAAWLTRADNPYLARNLANRTWGELLGEPILKRLDDPSPAAPAAALLDRLASDLRGSGYDLRAFVRSVVLSRVYAQAPQAADAKRPAWAARAVRPLTTDALHASIARATGHDGRQPNEEESEDDEEEPADAGPDVHAASELAVASAPGDAAKPEGPAMAMMRRPVAVDAEAEIDAEDEGDPPVELLGDRARSLPRTLVLMNGAYVGEAVARAVEGARSRLGPRIGRAHIEEAFLATLSRRPNDDELRLMMGLLKGAPNRGLEDVYWVLINSAEFQSNR